MKYEFPTYSIIKDFFYKNFNIAYKSDFDFSNYFEKYGNNIQDKFKGIYSCKPLYFKWKRIIFPVFIHNSSKNLYTSEGKISFDIYLNVFLFLSGWLEIINDSRDKHGRFPYEKSLQKKYHFTEIPVVNIYFELLFEVAQKNQIPIAKKPFEKPIIFTHDIDQFRSGWFENIQHDLNHFSLKSIYRIPKNIFIKLFRLEDDYFKGMKRMLAIDKKNNANSISFMLIKKSHQNADFDIHNKKYTSILEETFKEQDIGIHPSYSTFKDDNLYNEEIDTLTELSKKNITKSRQHFLRYDMKFTPKIIENSTIKVDYTLGFAEQYGFRNGIVNPFHLFNFEEKKAFEFKSIPLVFMDASLLNYNQNKSTKILIQEVENFISNTISNYNCNFSVLFHNSVFTNVKYEGFTELYKRLLNSN